MANLKEIRSRISSVSSTMKITSAMKMVSAAKLKKAQERMQNIKPYSEALHNVIDNILPTINRSEIKLCFSFSDNEKILVLAISSNRGLCGGFNANIFKKTKHLNPVDVDIICVGKKATEQFERNNYNVIESHLDILDNPTIDKSRNLSESIINKFKNGEYSSIKIVYNKFKNTATQITQMKQILPVQTSESTNSSLSSDYIFEPNKTNIINNIIPEKIHTQVFESILNSVASEHGARMTAMHKATDNAEELRQELTLSYNRQRQAAITSEILEIVAGAEALKNA